MTSRKNESQVLTNEELGGNLILHTIKVWVSHADHEVLQTGTDQESILDLVSRGEVTNHRLDGASVWVRAEDGSMTGGLDVCIEEDAPRRYIEGLTEDQEYLRDQEMEAMPCFHCGSDPDLLEEEDPTGPLTAKIPRGANGEE